MFTVSPVKTIWDSSFIPAGSCVTVPSLWPSGKPGLCVGCKPTRQGPWTTYLLCSAVTVYPQDQGSSALAARQTNPTGSPVDSIEIPGTVGVNQMESLPHSRPNLKKPSSACRAPNPRTLCTRNQTSDPSLLLPYHHWTASGFLGQCSQHLSPCCACYP